MQSALSASRTAVYCCCSTTNYGQLSEQGQWNMLRLGHYAYYSMSTLVEMLERGWDFVLELRGPLTSMEGQFCSRQHVMVLPIRPYRAFLGKRKKSVFANPPTSVSSKISAKSSADGLKTWLASQKGSGHTVFGYGAASRAVAMLAMADVACAELSGIADASAAKWGRRMPGTMFPLSVQPELVERPTRLRPATAT